MAFYFLSANSQCSGEHPSCKRCQNRGLVCEYAKEGRVRGPNKPKNGKVSTPADEPRNFPLRSHPGHNGRASEPADLSQAMLNALREHDKRLALAGASPISRRGSLSLDEHRSNRPRPPNLKLDISNHNYQLDGNFSQQDVNLPFQIPPNSAHDLRFTSSTIHTAPPIPISYHVQSTPTGHVLALGDNIESKFSAYAYEENRSPSTSSSTSMQGGSQPRMHVQNPYFQGMQQPHTTIGMPMEDAARLGCSATKYVGQVCICGVRLLTVASPLPSSPALAYPAAVSPSPTVASVMHYSPHDVKSPVPVHSPGVHANMAHIDAALVSLSMDPQAWVGMNMKPEFVDVGFGSRTEDGRQCLVGRQQQGGAPNGLRVVDNGEGAAARHGDHLQAIYPLDTHMQ